GPGATSVATGGLPPVTQPAVVRSHVRMYTMLAAKDGSANPAATGWRDAALVQREALRPGDTLDGPAVVTERNATTVVEPGWRLHAGGGEHGSLELRRVQPRASARAIGTDADPVMLEVFNHLFM